MELELEVIQKNAVTFIKVAGAIKEVDVYRFSRSIREIIKSNPGNIAVDVTGIVFLESHALGILVSHFTALQRQGRELLLINNDLSPNGYMKQLLEKTRLHEMIRVVSLETSPVQSNSV